MKDLLKKGLDKVSDTAAKVVQEFSDKFSVVHEKIRDMPYIASLEKIGAKKQQSYDEKHYFIVPFRLSETGFVLHSMRSLPDGVPEINSLPKRRVFHFANEHVETQLKHYLVEEARVTVLEQTDTSRSALQKLADDIDALDKKMTYGLLVIGGIAALMNPLAGLGIAAKAVIPGFMGIATKYGLRPVNEKLSRRQIEKDLRQAEAEVMNAFREATTLKIINPVLQELELALKTSQSEHDPLLDFDLGKLNIDELETEQWRELTVVALKNTYLDVINDEALHASAGLGPEDIRWLRVLFS